MSKILTFICLLLSAEYALGQTIPGFNLRTTCNFSNTKLYKICIDSDTIVGLGTSQDSTGLVTGIVLAKFDTFGNLLNAKLLQDTLIGPNPLYMRWGSLLKTSDGGYIMNVVPFLFAYPVVIKTDKDFNVDFVRKYPDIDDYDYMQCELKRIEDGYLLHGSVKRTNGLADGFVRKINLNGDPIWLKNYGNYGTSETVVDVNTSNSSYYAVALVRQASTPTSAYSSIKLIDQNGNELQTWDSEPEPPIGYLRGIISAEEGYLTYGLYVSDVLSNNTKLVMSTFSKLDSDFNIEKVQHYGKKVDLASEIMFYNFAETIDGNYVAAGRTSTVAINNGPTYARGWLMKFSPEGDSIWSRLDTSDIMPVSYLNRQSLGGVGVLSSGSIVAGGYVTKAEDNSSYIWLIKTTNDGCIDTLYCGLVSATEEENHLEQPPSVYIYPNPAQNSLTLEFGSVPQLDFEVKFIDLQGRDRLIKSFDAPQDKVAFSLVELPSGFYIVEIQMAGSHKLIRKKIIVSK